MNDPTSIEQEDNEVQLQELNEVYWPLKPLERLAKLFSEVDHDEIPVSYTHLTLPTIYSV